MRAFGADTGDRFRPNAFRAVKHYGGRILTFRLEQIGPANRIKAGLAALAVLAVLLAGRWFVPDIRGYGTHEQLGLGPCRTLQWFGTPCPFCGMTTAFAHAARGEFRAALYAQPAGTVFFVLSGVCGLFSLGVAVSGRRPRVSAPRNSTRLFWLTLVGMFILAWIYKLLSIRGNSA